MSISMIVLFFLFFAANAVVLAAAATAIDRLRQSYSRDQPARAEAGVPEASGSTSAHGRQQLLINLRTERLLKSMQKQLDDLATDDRNLKRLLDRPIPIDNAIRMAQSGATVEELTRSCGLNVGEAQLMHKLHCKADAASHAGTYP